MPRRQQVRVLKFFGKAHKAVTDLSDWVTSKALAVRRSLFDHHRRARLPN